jgi:hypothetical protein
MFIHFCTTKNTLGSTSLVEKTNATQNKQLPDQNLRILGYIAFFLLMSLESPKVHIPGEILSALLLTLLRLYHL